MGHQQSAFEYSALFYWSGTSRELLGPSMGTRLLDSSTVAPWSVHMRSCRSQLALIPVSFDVANPSKLATHSAFLPSVNSNMAWSGRGVLARSQRRTLPVVVWACKS
eukprot:1960471-Amphidinium_carterae.1